MIEVLMMGRLGNQMFQYAAAYALAKRNGTTILVNTSGYETLRSYRSFELWRFPDLHIQPICLANVIGTFVNSRLRQQPIPSYLMNGLGFDPAMLDLRDGSCIQGWFQSERFFVDAANDIRRFFELSSFLPKGAMGALYQLSKGRPIVAIHVRRGDYVGNELFEVDLTQYYRDAVMDFSATSDHCFIVFSDDIPWSMKNPVFQKKEIHFLPDLRLRCSHPLSEMALMAACDHNIIANSTFSWWAAWLNPSPAKKVLLPRLWLAGCTSAQCGVVAQNWSVL